VGRFASVCVAAIIVAGSACAADTRDVELSYRFTPEGCEGCDGYELTFRSGGHVWFTGLAGCAVPGTHHYLIPPSDFEALIYAFRRARFFSIPRKDEMAYDTGLLVVSYRDNARIHEVEHRVRTDPRLRTLERQLRAMGRPERYLTPSPDLYKELLAARWDINSKNEDGWTALRCAISRNRIETVQALLENNAAVSERDLQFAAWINSEAVPQLALKTGLDPHSQSAVDMLVTLAGTRGTTLPAVLQYGIPVDAVATRGKTALVAAINLAAGEYSVASLNAAANAASRANVTLLLEHGANPNLRIGKEGKTPLHHAAVSTETGLIDILRRHGARIDGRDAAGATPLMHATKSCSYWNIRALREAGADVRAVTADGRSALDLAMPQVDSGVDGRFARNRENCEKTRELLAR
jgi:ankyrin repeat protein